MSQVFTDAKIKALKPPIKGRKLTFDEHRDAPRGFGLKVTPAGRKVFVLRYFNENGKDRLTTIGDYPTWTLTAARERAKELRRTIDSGTDPLDEARRRKGNPNVREAVEMYVKRLKGLASEKAITRYFERDVVPTIGSMKVADVRRRDVIDLVEAKAAETPTAARHLLAYIKVLFDWCVDREYIEFNPAGSIKPKSIKPSGRKDALKPTTRKRVLDHEEIRSFWAEVEHCGTHRLTAIALKLVLLTGQRPGEVAGMSADEITGDTWIIPSERRGKTETEQRVPLTPLALQLIEAAKAEVARLSVRRKREPSGYIFEARPGLSVSVGALSKAVLRFADTLGNLDMPTRGRWRPHDLRRTARTEISACGVRQEIAERVLGHSAGGIVDVYNQHGYDKERREALEAWEARLLGILNPGAKNEHA